MATYSRDIGTHEAIIVKENHRLCRWFQKALAVPKIKYLSEARNHYKTIEKKFDGLEKLEKKRPTAISIAVGHLMQARIFR